MTPFARRLLSLMWPQKTRLVLGVSAGVLYAAGNAALMMALKLTCDLLFVAGSEGPTTRLSPTVQRLWPHLEDFLNAWLRSESMVLRLALIATIPMAMGLRLIGSFGNFYYLVRASQQAVHELRVQIFDHVLRLPVGYFSAARSGDLISRISGDTTALLTLLQGTLTTVVKEPITIVFLLAYLILLQPRLTLISLVVFPVCVLPVVIFGRRVRKAAQAVSLGSAQLTDTMQEAFTGQRVLKAYNLEPEFSRRFSSTSAHIVHQVMKAVRGNEIPTVLVEFAGALGVAFVFLFVLRNNRDGATMTSGDFFSFIGSVFLLYQPIKNLSRFYGQAQQARASVERVDELLGTRPDISDPPNPRPVAAAGAVVEFDRVTFSFGDRNALQDVQLRIQPGHLVALVGASGSGKTTLTSLLLRFYDPQQGAVRVGDVDLREVRTRDLRDQIAVVTQETILFNDTIRANIRLGRPGATDTEVEAAAIAAQAHGFILEKSGGYDFVIGERGASLSGGQRQRLAIARALLRNAPILILDEATSALDSESERAVQIALETLMRGRTTLCVAHRLSTIQHADLIVVMDQGRIVERGQHEELLAANGTYARLHALQFRA
ncbi:MAG: ABC transporter ATP-binding protein [Verrucomicrobia bacterium]|nr:ABC transporter ATP-binding protein [Verrucomicrobiota bacterium]